MNEDSIDFGEIIAIVAKKNKIILDEKDPILAVATINDYIMNKHYEKSNEALAIFTLEIEKIQSKVSKQALVNANNIINSSLNLSSKNIEKNTNNLIIKLNESVEQKIILEVKPLQKALNVSNTLLIISCSLLALSTAFISIKFV